MVYMLISYFKIKTLKLLGFLEAYVFIFLINKNTYHFLSYLKFSALYLCDALGKLNLIVPKSTKMVLILFL